MLAKSQYLCSEEETEAKPAKSVHRCGNQQATMVTLLKRTGRTLPGFSYSGTTTVDFLYEIVAIKKQITNIKVPAI